VTGEDRCELTELLAAECACSRHRGGQVVDLEHVDTVGQAFLAGYGGRCARGDGIRPGDTIARCAEVDLGYVHVGGCPA
jgi:hypothetical protein